MNTEKNESEQAGQPTLTSYCMKTKTKNVPMLEAVITKTSKGAFMAQGVDEHGNKMTTLLNKDKAMACIEAGIAKKGWED